MINTVHRLFPAHRRLIGVVVGIVVLLVTGILLAGRGSAAPAAIGGLDPAADIIISINPGNVPTTADGFATHTCDLNQGGGPSAGLDVWAFVLPGNHATSGDFVAVTAHYS